MRTSRNTQPEPQRECECCQRTQELERVVAALCRLWVCRTGGLAGLPQYIPDARAVTEFAARRP